MATTYTVPGIDQNDNDRVVDILQGRLTALIDLQLTLKHIHWNVIGPTFIGVHLMLDPQVDAVRVMVDDVAERIATMGGEPMGTPGFVATNRTWDDYSVGRASTMEHLGALDLVYGGVVEDHRRAIDETDELDPVAQDMLIQQSEQLERFQWFVRAHLEDADGRLATEGTSHLVDAAARGRQAGERGAAGGAAGKKAVRAAKAAQKTRKRK